MTNLAKIDVIKQGDVLVVDSRLIADELGVSHESFMKTIRKHETKIEQRFGIIRFKIGEIDGRGRPEKYALLTEPQATTLMTFSRNTDQVVECKLNLVEAFERAKTAIKTVIPQQSERIRELELQNAVLDKQLSLRHLDNSMLTMHGAPTVLALRGMADQVIEVKTVITEVIDEKTGAKFRGATLKQMADILKTKFGLKFKSGADLERHIESLDRSDLIAQMKRPVLAPYIPEEFMEEAIEVIRNSTNRQMLLGE